MFYLARWITVEEAPGAFDNRPDIDTGNFAAIDLRGSADAMEGRDYTNARSPEWCALWTPDTVQPKRGRLIRLGDDPSDKSGALTRVLRNRLGWSGLRGSRTIAEALYDFYLDETDDLEDGRPNRLRPRRDGRLELRVGPHVLGRQLGPSSLSATITDDFNRANESLGDSANWTNVSTGDATDVVSNQLQNAATAVSYYSYTGSAASGDDQYCQIDVTSTGYQQCGPQVRMLGSGANASGYMAYWQGDSANLVRIRRTNTSAAPGRTTLASNTGVTENTPIVRIEVEGSGLDALIDGASKVTTTDTTYPASSTRRVGGIYFYSSGQTADDWEFGDLGAAAQDITLTALSNGAAATAISSLDPGVVSRTLTAIPSGNSPTSPTLSPGAVSRTLTPIFSGSSATALSVGDPVPPSQGITLSPIVNGGAPTALSLAAGPVSATLTPISSGHSVTALSLGGTPIGQAITLSEISSGHSVTALGVTVPLGMTLQPIVNGGAATPLNWVRIVLVPTHPVNRVKVPPLGNPSKRRRYIYP